LEKGGEMVLASQNPQESKEIFKRFTGREIDLIPDGESVGFIVKLIPDKKCTQSKSK
tara:strand:+ start:952 stop:1122 length:171 start_codon:yes stop_codon:yes gene_type:complete